MSNSALLKLCSGIIPTPMRQVPDLLSGIGFFLGYVPMQWTVVASHLRCSYSGPSHSALGVGAVRDDNPRVSRIRARPWG